MPDQEHHISVALVEDHLVFVDALRLLIQKEPEFAFAGAAHTIQDGRELVQRARPAVLLMDVELPDGSGLDLAPEVKRLSPETQIVVLTHLSDEKTLLKAVEAGVSGFLTKNCSLKELMDTIRQAAQGEIVMPTSLLMGLLTRISRAKEERLRRQEWEPLTGREQEILRFLARGASVQEIADQLTIAPLTVRTHIRNLMSKLGVHSRLEAVSFALRHGLIPPPA